jgi:hypothetical protein
LINTANRKAIVKRPCIIFVLIVCLSSSVFPQGAETEDESGVISDSPVVPWQESGVAFGLEYGNYWGNSADNGKTHTTSVAYNMYQYIIWNGGKSGFFMQTSLLGFPYTDTINGERPGYIDYYGRQIGITTGFFF